MEPNKRSEKFPRYRLDELQTHAMELFSVKPEIVYGALFETANELQGVEEARQKIQQFLKAKVN